VDPVDEHVPVEELVCGQGVKPFTSVEDLALTECVRA
jgi:hypothetical protein